MDMQAASVVSVWSVEMFYLPWFTEILWHCDTGSCLMSVSY